MDKFMGFEGRDKRTVLCLAHAGRRNRCANLRTKVGYLFDTLEVQRQQFQGIPPTKSNNPLNEAL